MLSRLFRSSRIENPNVSPTDTEAMNRLFGIHTSASGMEVSSDSALRFSPVWQGVTMISQDVAVPPTFVYRRTTDENGNEGKERDRRHPAYRLLRRKANPLHTSAIWKQIMVSQALLFGNSYSVINRNGRAEPVELLPLNPKNTKPVETRDGSVIYETRIRHVRTEFAPTDVVHLRGLPIGGLAGESIIEKGQDSIGRGLAAERYAGKFFSNGAAPLGVLQHPHRLTDQAASRLRQSWSDVHGSVDNSNRVALLEEGMTWNAMGVDPEQAQMIATMEFSVRDAARWLNVPPHRLGDATRTSFNSVEQENLSYQISTLSPWFCKLREEEFDKLLTEKQKREESHTIEELRLAILMADSATRATFYQMAITNGWLSRDEVRQFENLNPIPDGTGQQFLVPMNMQPSGQGADDGEPEPEPEPNPEPDDDDDDDDRSVPTVSQVQPDRVERIVYRHAAKRIAGRLDNHWGRGHRPQFSELKKRHLDVITSMLAECEEASVELGLTVRSSSDMAMAIIRKWHENQDTDDSDGLSGRVLATVLHKESENGTTLSGT